MSEFKVEEFDEEMSFPDITITRWSDGANALAKVPEHDFGSSSFQLMIADEMLYPKADELVYSPTEEESKKNRYNNILPSILHRVKLEKKNSDGSDYFNACYVRARHLDGANTKYVFSQAPTPFAINDFWQAIWEQKVELVVMLTKEVESNRVKADRYWPEDDGKSKKFGQTEVASVVDSENDSLIVRVMTLKQGDETRTITHIQYTAWPDHGVPENFEAIVDLLRVYREKKAGMSSADVPVFVHCSAGIGRTGTFSMIDMIIDHLTKGTPRLNEKGEPVLNMFRLLLDLRLQRPGSIQTPDQYLFVHQFVSYAIEKGLFGLKK